MDCFSLPPRTEHVWNFRSSFLDNQTKPNQTPLSLYVSLYYNIHLSLSLSISNAFSSFAPKYFSLPSFRQKVVSLLSFSLSTIFLFYFFFQCGFHFPWKMKNPTLHIPCLHFSPFGAVKHFPAIKCISLSATKELSVYCLVFSLLRKRISKERDGLAFLH